MAKDMLNETLYSVNHLIASRTLTNPDLPILGVPDKALKFTKYTYKQLDSAASLLAHHLIDTGLIEPRRSGDSKSKLCTALFAHSGFEYVVCEWALSRLGYSVLFVSPNNSAPAVAHLLKATGATHVFVHPQFGQVMAEASAALGAEGLSVKSLSMPDPDVYSLAAQSTADPKKLCWDPILDYQDEQDLIAFIVHSSGSTGFPKPIFISHRHSVANFSVHFNISGFTTLPLYHNHGHSCFYRGIHAAKPLYLFPAGVLPLTTLNIMGLLASPDCDAQAFFGVPFALKLLAETEEGVDALRKMSLVMYGGSPCPDELGDKLVQAGVPLVGHYGLTETGQLMTSFRDFATDKYWNWIRPSSYGKDYVRFEERGEGAYELFVLTGYKTLTMSNQPDGSYGTKDLFLKHPTVDGLYKFCGRLDDTLVMVNGEKTNPVPIELTLRGECPYISDAVIFGAGRAQIGALIILSELCDPAKQSREEIISLIEPALKLANASAPSHSQLAPEAIVLRPFGFPIPRADKGSFLRPKVYVALQDIIDNVYKLLAGEDAEGEETQKQKLSSLEDAARVVTTVIQATIGDKAHGLTPGADLFEHGLDSLQSTRIRNSLQRDLDLNGNKLSSNFVFDNPSINKMAEHLLALSSGDTSGPAAPSHVEQMLQLVEKYRHFSIPKLANGYTNGVSTRPKVVALTGTTGSLGAALLDQFLSDPTIATVYCLNRAKDDDDATRRTADSMKLRGLTSTGNYKGTNDPRVICLATDLSRYKLGLSDERYQEIASKVTLIIHNAWAVNFNLSIGSFEPHIRGAVNLIKLGLDSPHPEATSFYFSSSVSAVFAWRGPGPVPEQVTDDPTFAQNMGYAQSKWVTEKLCEIAAQTTPLKAGVLRIGQMVGDSRTGIWNETEAISLIFKSAESIQVLPALDESPSWLPVDYAARTIVELTTVPRSNTKECPCWHVVQPRLVPWMDILKSFAASGIKFDAIPRRQWVAALRESDPDPEKNPTIKLLSFFEGKYDHDDEKMSKRYPLMTERTCEKSQSLRTAPVADDELVSKFVKAWRSTGFLH